MKKVFEVFWRFLFLGCISFGGPAAHIGYFQKTFVGKLNWLDQTSFANLISLSQFLPGPGSSQLGFAIGLRQAGVLGGIAAFLGFTLPSFILLYLLAINLNTAEQPWVNHVINGLKLLAVVVVADACLTMFKSFCNNHTYKLIAFITAITLIIFPQLSTQIFILLIAAGFGFLVNPSLKSVTSEPAQHFVPDSNKFKTLPLILFFAMLFALPLIIRVGLLTEPSELMVIFNQFYQAGSMVFGGGHVVLPLLQQTIGEALSNDIFLTGYASAQAVPGPMFTIATFLGAELFAQNPLLAATVATLAVFLPGFLLLLAVESSWQSLAKKPKVASAVMAVNAAVVGLLVSALYHPIFSSAVSSAVELICVLLGFYLLRIIKLPIIVLVLTFIGLGLLLAQLASLNII
ncbi:MAG: chromate efflux transporter [Colwellia sp.]|nr:chromate efflux transporter [Colwellia sp.]